MAESDSEEELEFASNQTKIAGGVPMNEEEYCFEAEQALKMMLKITTMPVMKKNIVELTDSEDSDTDTMYVSPKKKRRRRRVRKRKSGANKPSWTPAPSKSKTKLIGVSMSPTNHTTCGSEYAEISAKNENDSSEGSVESDEAISQDEVYQDQITERFLLNFEEREIKENLFIEHEKLVKEIVALKSKLATQLEKSDAMKRSLEKLKSKTSFLEGQKRELLGHVKAKENEIAALKVDASTLKASCDELLQRKQHETSYIDLDRVKSQLIMKEDELEVVKRKNINEFKELAKNHSLFLSKILTEAQEINLILYKAKPKAGKPELQKTNNIPQLLKHLREDVEMLLGKSTALEFTIKQLQEEVENQNKSIAKASNEKKLLRDELAEVNQQNKVLIKDKAKLEREKEVLRKEATGAKNSAQNFKVRLEELKASVRFAKRENEAVVHEKQELAIKLKQVDKDYEALLLEKNKKDDVKDAPISCKEQQQQRLEQVKHQLQQSGSQETKADVADKLVKKTSDSSSRINSAASSLIPKPGKDAIKQPSKLSEITRIAKDGFCLNQVSQFITRCSLNNEIFGQQLYCHCGCHKNEIAQKRFLAKIPLLFRLKSLENLPVAAEKKVSELVNYFEWCNSKKLIINLRRELDRVRTGYESLKAECDDQAMTMDYYELLAGGLSHVLKRVHDERVTTARDMKCVNRELERYSVLMDEQKGAESQDTQLTGAHEGISLVHAMFQRVRNFAGRFMGTPDVSVPCVESVDHAPLKTLKLNNKVLKDKVACSEHNFTLLKANLHSKRTKAIEIRMQVHAALFGHEQRPSVESPEQKTCKRAKGKNLLSFLKRKDGNEKDCNALSEQQVAVVIDLVQANEQLESAINESLYLESKLESLATNYRRYIEAMAQDYSSYEDELLTDDGIETAEFERVMCLKEKERLEKELSFLDLHSRLLDKHVELLKNDKKACLKALKRYDEDMKGCIPAYNTTVSALAKLLSGTSEETTANSTTPSVCLGGMNPENDNCSRNGNASNKNSPDQKSSPGSPTAGVKGALRNRGKKTVSNV